MAEGLHRMVEIPELAPEMASSSISQLLSTLSSNDSLALFMLASNGIKADSSTIEKTGLTKRKYYTRLNQLIDAGLISKYDGIYAHTSLGRIIYQNHILQLMETAKNRKTLQMIDTLRNTKQYSNDEIQNFIEKVVGRPRAMNNPSIDIKFFWSYSELASWIVQRSHYVKREILLASRFFDEVIINAVSSKANAGIDVRVIADRSLIGKFLNEQRGNSLDKVDKHARERKTVTTNPWYPSRVKRIVGQVPFCLMIFDRNEIALELVDWSETQKIKWGITCADEKMAADLTKYYFKLWDATAPTTAQQQEEATSLSRH